MRKKPNQEKTNVVLFETPEIQALKIHLGATDYRKLEALSRRNGLHPFAQWKELQAESRTSRAV